jgi:hypothetical protein
LRKYGRILTKITGKKPYNLKIEDKRGAGRRVHRFAQAVAILGSKSELIFG